MDQPLNVDRYLTQRLGIVRRLVEAQLPATTAECWVAAWEAEAQRRGLEPGDREWWRSGWEWIAQACGGPDPGGRSLPEEAEKQRRTGPFAGSAVRVERRVLVLADSLLRPTRRRAPVEEEVLIRVMDGIRRSSDVIAGFLARLDARAHDRTPDRAAPDHQWLSREMEHLCAAYEAAVGETHGRELSHGLAPPYIDNSARVGAPEAA